MKKILSIIAVLLFLFVSQTFAAGTCAESIYYKNRWNGIIVKKLACTADASDASFPNTSIIINGYILKVETDPGATAPTDLYDIVLNSLSAGVDIMGGEINNRDLSTSEQAMPKIGNGYGVNYINKITMQITGNTVNSALVDVYIWIITSVPTREY